MPAVVPSSTSGSSSSKSVCFKQGDELVEILSEVPSRQDLMAQEDDCLSVLYYNKDEYKASRAMARSQSGELQRNNGAACLNDVFAEKSKASQANLRRWTTAAHGCRGLEKWSHQAHGETRQMEQFTAIMAILQAQYELTTRNNYRNSNNNKETSLVSDEKQLRRVCQTVTRNARHFARMMGKADSYAVAAMEQVPSDNAQQIIKASPKERQQQQQQQLQHQDEEDISMSESMDDSITTAGSHETNGSITKISIATSLLSMSDEDESIDGGLFGDENDKEDVLFVAPLQNAVQDEEDLGGGQPRPKNRKLRLLKKLRRRLSTGSSISVHRAIKRDNDDDDMATVRPIEYLGT